MPSLAITIALLAIECGVGYRIQPRADLSVADNVGTHWEDGFGYRIAAHGMNHCCLVEVEILNVSRRPLVVVPGAATLVSKSCGVIESNWTVYAVVRGVNCVMGAGRSSSHGEPRTGRSLPRPSASPVESVKLELRLQLAGGERLQRGLG